MTAEPDSFLVAPQRRFHGPRQRAGCTCVLSGRTPVDYPRSLCKRMLCLQVDPVVGRYWQAGPWRQERAAPWRPGGSLAERKARLRMAGVLLLG